MYFRQEQCIKIIFIVMFFTLSKGLVERKIERHMFKTQEGQDQGYVDGKGLV